MTTQNSGRTALITGASSGIGQELAKLFAKDGYNLVLVARSEDQLNRLADVFTQNYATEQITVISKDLAKENAAQELYDDVRGRGITVNILVNDAGLGTYGKFANETDWETEKDIIHLNTVTLTHLTKLYLKEMVQRNEGRVLNLASLVSITPNPLMSVYAATKAYVYNFTASLVNELKDTNVTVTALMPNATDTDFFNKAGASDIKVTDELQDPVMVAHDGYDALMKGEPKVVPGGMKNKVYEVMGHVAPQQAAAGLMRSRMERKPNPEHQRQVAWAWGIGIAAVIIAGVVVASLLTGDDEDDVDAEIDNAEKKYKTGQAKYRAQGLLNDAKDSLTSTKNRLSDSVHQFNDDVLDTVDTARSRAYAAKDKLANTAKNNLNYARSRAYDAKDNLVDNAKDGLDYAKSRAYNAKDNLVDTAKDSLDYAKNRAYAAKENLADHAADAVDYTKDKFADAKSKISHEAADRVKTAKSKIADAQDDAHDRFDDLADEASDRWDAVKNIITRVVSNILA